MASSFQAGTWKDLRPVQPGAYKAQLSPASSGGSSRAWGSNRCGLMKSQSSQPLHPSVWGHSFTLTLLEFVLLASFLWDQITFIYTTDKYSHLQNSPCSFNTSRVKSNLPLFLPFLWQIQICKWFCNCSMVQTEAQYSLQDKICSDSEQIDKGFQHKGDVNQCTPPAIRIRLVNWQGKR